MDATARRLPTDALATTPLRLPPIPAELDPDDVRASSAQERKLTREVLHPNVHRRVVTLSWLVRGDLDVGAMARAIDALVARHAVLRSAFRRRSDGFRIVPGAEVPGLVVEDAASLASDGEALRDRLLTLAQFRPDLWAGPLAEFRLLRLTRARHVFVISVDHNVFDGESSKVVLGELLRDYEVERSGARADRTPPAVTFGHFAEWQHRILDSPAGDELRAFWRDYLAGSPGSVALRGRDPRVRGYAGRLASAAVDGAEAEALRAVCLAHRVTPFVYWLACLAAVAAADTDADVTVFGSVANRRRPELAHVVGHLSNTIVFRPEVRLDEPFGDLLRTARRHVLAVIARADLPFPEIVRIVWPERYATPPVLPGLYLDARAPAALTGPRTPLSIDLVAIDPPKERSDPGFNVWVTTAGDSTRLSLLHDRGLPDSVADRLFARVRRLAVEAARDAGAPSASLLDRG